MRHITSVWSALQGTVIETVHRAADALNQSMQKSGQGEPQEEGTVEGEFREV